MQVYSQYKFQLMETIDHRIEKIDAYCVDLTQQSYLYSQERIDRLSQQRNAEMLKLQQQKQLQQNNNNCLKFLKDKLHMLKQQNQANEAKIEQHTIHIESLDRKIMFMQQKNKEDLPHIQPYLQQKDRASKALMKVQYVQEKLSTLQQKYWKQCEEVEYKQRLIKMMKDKLNGIRENKTKANCLNFQEAAIVHETNSVIMTEVFGVGVESEPSHYKETSIQSTYRN